MDTDERVKAKMEAVDAVTLVGNQKNHQLRWGIVWRSQENLVAVCLRCGETAWVSAEGSYNVERLLEQCKGGQ